jgi:hypothetical protein
MRLLCRNRGGVVSRKHVLMQSRPQPPSWYPEECEKLTCAPLVTGLETDVIQHLGRSLAMIFYQSLSKLYPLSGCINEYVAADLEQLSVPPRCDACYARHSSDGS